MWFAAAGALVPGVVLCVISCARSEREGAVAALQTAGPVVTCILMALAVGFDRSDYLSVGLVVSALSFAGCMAFVRSLELQP